jgi:uncharacterized membrane protein
MSNKPVTVAVATYANKALAEQDFDALHGVKHEGQIDHLAVAVVRKDADGKLSIDRHNTSAKHAAWGTGVLGGALAVISAPLGIVFLGPPRRHVRRVGGRGWSLPATSGTTSPRMSPQDGATCSRAVMPVLSSLPLTRRVSISPVS